MRHLCAERGVPIRPLPDPVAGLPLALPLCRRPAAVAGGVSTLVATDLDRTLVHSARAAGPDVPGDVLCLERRRGVPTAMLTRRTAATLVELARRATWVPATTRSVGRVPAPRPRAGLARDHRRGTRSARAAVCCWSTARPTRRGRRGSGTCSPAVRRSPRPPTCSPATSRASTPERRDRCATPTASCSSPASPTRARDWLDELAADCGARGWRVARHGAKVHLLPARLDKSVAVAEVRERVAAARLLAAGDSPLDADLLLAADAGVQPADGALHAAGWRAAHVAVTPGVGLRGGGGDRRLAPGAGSPDVTEA